MNLHVSITRACPQVIEDLEIEMRHHERQKHSMKAEVKPSEDLIPEYSILLGHTVTPSNSVTICNQQSGTQRSLGPIEDLHLEHQG